MSNYFRKWQFIVFFGVFVLFFTLLASPVGAETPKRGGWITVATYTDPIGLDPHLTRSFSTFMFTEQVYECLLRYNHKMEIKPCLATSYEQPDVRTYIFHLRKGVKWHDGKPFTAEDVKFTFDRVMDPKTGAYFRSTLRLVEHVEILDSHTVKIKLKEILPGFIHHMAYARDLAIVPKHVVLKHGSLQKVTVGTGPFKLKKYSHGVSATFVRNDDYWEPGIPYIDGFKMLVVPQQSSRVAGMRKGTYDISWLRNVAMAKLVAREPHIDVFPAAISRQGWFWLNHTRFPFNNLKLRQAVSVCLDRQAIADKVILGNGVLSAIIPPAAAPFALSPGEVAELPFHKQDYDLARRLLKEAGYPDGFEFTIKTASYISTYVPTCEIIKEQLAPVGIRAKIQAIEVGVMQKVRRTLDYQAKYAGGGWWGDPCGYFYRFMHGSSVGNEIGQNDPEINNLMDLCKTTMDFEKRKEYFRQLQYKAAEKVTSITLHASPANYEMVNKRVKGYKYLPNKSRSYLRYAWLAE